MASYYRRTSILLALPVNLLILRILSQQFRLASAISCIILTEVTLYLTYRLWIYPSYISPLRFMPGPKGGNILIGHLMDLYSLQPLGEIIRRWTEDIPNDGLLRFRDVGGKDGLIVTSPAMLKAVLSDDWSSYPRDPKFNALLSKFMGKGLTTASSQDHGYQRRQMQPAFQNSIVRKLRPLYWRKALELTEALKAETSKPEFDFSTWCSCVTLDILGTAGFGQDFGSIKEPELTFRLDLNEFREPTRASMACWFSSLLFGPDFIFSLPLSASRRQVEIAGTMNQHAVDLIKHRRESLASASNDQSKPHTDLLSFLITNSTFNDTELASQVRTLMMAGQITVATSLGWCIYLLSRHPQWQSSLREEIRHCTSSSSPDESERLPRIDELPLLNAIVSETLRLYPAVPTSLRRSVKETNIGVWCVPAKTKVLMSAWAINRSTELWGKDATLFRPRRWLNENGKFNKTGGASSNYAYMTFSNGSRNCIGQEFARSELKFLVTAVIERYAVEATRDESMYYPTGVIAAMSPAHGVWLRFTEVQ